MAQEILLVQDVSGLGSTGDVVHVADGYARNYLLPQKLAVPLTAVTQRRIAALRKERAEREAAAVDAAKSLAGRLEKAGCTIAAKTGEGGRLFGSVTTALIAETLAQQGIEIDRHQVQLEEPLRETGVFTVPVRLHPEVTAALKVWVTEE